MPVTSSTAPAPSATADTIAFIGGGNMAASLIGGLVAAGHPAASIRVSEPDAERAAALDARFGLTVAADNVDAVTGADIVVLATKPQQVAGAIRGLQLSADATLISICAGVRIASLRALIGSGNWAGAIVRAMPNTPALFGAGITGLFASEGAPPRARMQAETVLAAAGKVCWVDREPLMDAVTAVSGSGPAYFFLLAEAMADAGVALGLTPADAKALALQTFIGAARMAEGTGTDVATLRAQVTSRGGTTQAALETLEAAGFRRILGAALKAADTRGAQLGDELAATI
ncbi:MAG: pyrroline-5-carboxylate reductase [Xanthomonadaceae bacterium]|nr:pyrroline-5-carboxylate reductase [Xanthomonadaceae bacterium]